MPRPTSPILSRNKIATAALQVVDDHGDFTIGQVAGALGVRPSSLYNHVSGRTEIIELMRDHLVPEWLGDHPAADDFTAAPGTPWQDALEAFVTEYRNALGAHPRLVPLLTSSTVAAPKITSFYQALAAVLREAGFLDEHLLDAVTTVDGFAIGAALDLVAPEHIWDPSHFTDGPMHDALHNAPSGRRRADQSFAFGLQVLVQGLRAQCERLKSDTSRPSGD
ncbi:TetR/AcrR family transcriptional regulator C-terminal domain-containing protein [Streptomyces inhibens]|uniref:TetR/AcrR family transcriptional regulator C-terminal domain-containing protein n=1 Tax=Streptomyces inhibens TaxID=2293571 RepID=UPI0036BC6516